MKNNNPSNKKHTMTGIVKFYKSEEGYGFVSDGEKDYYFNFHAVKGKEMPAVGDDVTFTLSDKKPPEGKNPAIESLIIIQKAQNNNTYTDDGIECPYCGRKITPRMVLHYGRPLYSVCPYCGKEVRDFRPFWWKLCNILSVVILVCFVVFVLLPFIVLLLNR